MNIDHFVWPTGRPIPDEWLFGSRWPAAGGGAVSVQPAGLPGAGGAHGQAGDLWPLPTPKRPPVQRHVAPAHPRGHPQWVVHSVVTGVAEAPNLLKYEIITVLEYHVCVGGVSFRCCGCPFTSDLLSWSFIRSSSRHLAVSSPWRSCSGTTLSKWTCITVTCRPRSLGQCVPLELFLSTRKVKYSHKLVVDVMHRIYRIYANSKKNPDTSVIKTIAYKFNNAIFQLYDMKHSLIHSLTQYTSGGSSWPCKDFSAGSNKLRNIFFHSIDST